MSKSLYEMRADIFRDTVLQCRNNPVLRMHMQQSVDKTIVYGEKQPFRLDAYEGYRLLTTPRCIVIQNTILGTARDYTRQGKRVAILNCANPVRLGGGVDNGAVAQEESICISSTLYPCLNQNRISIQYYQIHASEGDTNWSDRVIYSPDIVVFKSDELVPEMLPEEQWYQIDVLTAAAPYIRDQKYTDYSGLKRIFRNRIRNFFSVSMSFHVDYLILGAFGCGAIGNPPEIVAMAFREVMREQVGWGTDIYPQYVFAIPDTQNFTWFRRIMKDDMYLEGINEYHCSVNGFSCCEFYNKKISFMGDSISTFQYWNPLGYSVFYNDEIARQAGIEKCNDTWWGNVSCK